MERTDTDTARRFGRDLAGIVAIGIALRVAAALWLDAHSPPKGDAVWYLDVARLVAHGPGFVEPLTWSLQHRSIPTAEHPPLYPLYLVVLELLGGGSTLLHRLWSLLPAAGTLVLAGVVARDLAGPRAGRLAALAAAISIPLVFQDVNLWSEGLFAMTVLLVVWGCYRLEAAPGPGRALLVGGAVGLAALTRAEGALLFAALVVVVVRGRAPWHERGRRLLAGFAGLAIVLAPWFVFNLTRFERPVVLTTGLGPLVWSSNCGHTYSGRDIGSWGFVCAAGHGRLPRDQSLVDQRLLDRGLDYMSRHLDELPWVISVRVMRTFGLWHPNRVADETLELDAAGLVPLVTLAVLQYWAYVVVGAVGLYSLRRRGKSVVPVVAPIAVALVVSVVAYGSLRFRIAMDAVLPILVGIGAVAFVDRRRDPRSSRSVDSPLGSASARTSPAGRSASRPSRRVGDHEKA